MSLAKHLRQIAEELKHKTQSLQYLEIMDIFKLSVLAFVLYAPVNVVGSCLSEGRDIWTVKNLQVDF